MLVKEEKTGLIDQKILFYSLTVKAKNAKYASGKSPSLRAQIDDLHYNDAILEVTRKTRVQEGVFFPIGKIRPPPEFGASTYKVWRLVNVKAQ